MATRHDLHPDQSTETGRNRQFAVLLGSDQQGRSVERRRRAPQGLADLDAEQGELAFLGGLPSSSKRPTVQPVPNFSA